jgi:electron transport complex protein RnfD
MAMIDSPAIKERSTVSMLMFTVILGLLPALFLQIGFFGNQILGNLFFGIGFALFLEAVCLKLRNYPIRPFILDGSAFVTAWLLIISVPANIPIWTLLIGIFFSIVVAKHAYGGIGSNPFNPAMIGYAVLLISFPKIMTNWPISDGFEIGNFVQFSQFFSIANINEAYDAIVSATPLDQIKTSLFLEKEVNAIPISLSTLSSYQMIAILYFLGGIFLVYKKVITWHLPLSLILSIYIFSGLLHLYDQNTYMSPLFHLLNGATFLAAFFIITDPVSSPTTLKGKIIFGILIGLITVIIRNYGGYPDGIAFAVIFMNICVPLIEKFTQPKVFGYE